MCSLTQKLEQYPSLHFKQAPVDNISAHKTIYLDTESYLDIVDITIDILFDVVLTLDMFFLHFLCNFDFN